LSAVWPTRIRTERKECVMLDQLQMTTDGQVLDKVQVAIRRLQAFEPPEGYFVAFSGGKDSQCVYHLCKMAGVKFDAHYSVTSVDPP
jgi:3'-phosphoadenosine 5'-phosphosulfate sulfotransferase (PAPS reductase)/FAD synthetase